MTMHSTSSCFRVALVACPLGSPNHIPAALPYLASVVKELGYEVTCWDLNLDLCGAVSREVCTSLADVDKWIGRQVDRQVEATLARLANRWAEAILSERPSIVGFSTTMTNIRASLLLAAAIKKSSPSTYTCFGGPECTLNWSTLVLNDAVDFAVLGDGERPFAQLLQSLSENGDQKGIQSLVFRGSDSGSATPAVNPDLDALPYPDFSTIDIGQYGYRGVRELPISGSAGCPRNCRFCNRRLLNGRYRFKSANGLVEELEHYVRAYDVRKFTFVDSLINGNVKQLYGWTSRVVRRQMKIRWQGNAILTPEMTKSLLDTLSRSGCIRLSYGLESASPRILKSMGKRQEIGEIEQVIRDTSKSGILVTCFVIVGYPLETESDFQMTVQFLRRNSRYINAVQVTPFFLAPGSYVAEHKAEYQIVGEGADTWESPTSTREIRMQRVRELRLALKESGLLESLPTKIRSVSLS